MRNLSNMTALSCAFALAACSGAADGDAGGDGTTTQPPVNETLNAEIADTPGDVAYGEAMFASCSSCHSIEPGLNGIGPTLHGVVGREIGGGDYSYSSAAQAMDGTWTRENLNAYLANPREFMPGTSMSFAGINDRFQRADVIAYLETLE